MLTWLPPSAVIMTREDSAKSNIRIFFKVFSGHHSTKPYLHWHFTLCCVTHTIGSHNSLLVRVLDSWSKGCELESWQGWQEIFLLHSQLCVLTFILCPVQPLLLQWRVKDPSHSAKSAGSGLHLNRHTPLTQRSWNELTMPLSRHSVGTYPETSSHTTCQETSTEPLWTDLGIKSGICSH